MQSITKRWPYVLSVFAIAVGVVFAGCTDAMVGPDDASVNNRTVELPEGTTLEQDGLSDITNNPNTQARISQRYFMPFPPPDSLQPPSNGTPPPVVGRVAHRFSEPFPLPDSLRPSGSGVPPMLPISRIANRFSPILLPPDTTSNGTPSNGGN